MVVGGLGHCSLHRRRGAHGAKRVIGLVLQRVEHDEDRVAGEPFDQPALTLGDDRNGGRPIRVEHLDDVHRGTSVREAGEAREIGEQDRHLRLAPSELGDRGLQLEPVRERWADVRTEQIVDTRHLARGALEQDDLLGSEPLTPEPLEDGSERLAGSDRRHELLDRAGRAPIDAFERLLQVEPSEGCGDRTLATVFGADRDDHDREGDGHQDVPFPPRHVPAPREGDRDQGLGEQQEGDRDRQRQQPPPHPEDPQVPPRREGVQPDPHRREQPERERRLLLEWSIEERHAGERPDRPGDQQEREGASDRRSAPKDPCRVRAAELDGGPGREP